MPKSKDFETTPLRMPVTLDATVTELATKLGKSKQDTMRLCMELGAKWIQMNGYDPTREITRFSALDTMMEVITEATNQLNLRDQKLTEVTGELTRLVKKLGSAK